MDNCNKECLAKKSIESSINFEASSACMISSLADYLHTLLERDVGTNSLLEANNQICSELASMASIAMYTNININNSATIPGIIERCCPKEHRFLLREEGGSSWSWKNSRDVEDSQIEISTIKDFTYGSYGYISKGEKGWSDNDLDINENNFNIYNENHDMYEYNDGMQDNRDEYIMQLYESNKRVYRYNEKVQLYNERIYSFDNQLPLYNQHVYSYNRELASHNKDIFQYNKQIELCNKEIFHYNSIMEEKYKQVNKDSKYF